MPQTKQQEKTSEKKLNEIMASNLTETEFKTLVIKMLSELRGRIDDLREDFSRGHRNYEEEPASNEDYNNRDEYTRRNQQYIR